MQLMKWSFVALVGLLSVYLVLQFGTRLLARLPLLAIAFQGSLIVWSLCCFAFLLRSHAHPAARLGGGLGLVLLVALFSVTSFYNVRLYRRHGHFDSNLFQPFRVTTEDGVEIAGVASRDGFPRAVVLSHGVADSKDGHQLVAMAKVLAEDFDVYLFDYRGFGESGGGSTFGAREVLDLKAVLDLVNSRGYRKVGVVGNSMGGMVSVMEVATYRNAQAVVTAGSPASFKLVTGMRASLGRWAVDYWLGRALYEMGSQVRVAAGFVPIEPFLSADDLSPIPYLVIHGTEDPLVDVSDARRLYEAAREPKELWIYEGGGHSISDLGLQFGDEFRFRLRDWLDRQLGQ
ncbi:MAG: alpha/beta fold hydrolase [Anaerolineae bacterium]|nr:alpha/beta fold hydrolase [Anaerolineae bacterium]